MLNKSTPLFFSLLFVLGLCGCTYSNQSGGLNSSTTNLDPIQTQSLFDRIAMKKHQILSFPSHHDSNQVMPYSEQEAAELEFDLRGGEVDVRFFATNEVFVSEPNDSIDFIEKLRHHGNSVHYTKWVNGQVVEEKDTLVNNEGDIFEALERN